MMTRLLVIFLMLAWFVVGLCVGAFVFGCAAPQRPAACPRERNAIAAASASASLDAAQRVLDVLGVDAGTP